MAGKIKGITIAMEADTTGVTKGLKEITSESVNVSKSLKSVNSLLKLDPGNTTLIAEQQKLLAQNIETTKQKLNALKAAEDDVNKAYQNGSINTDEYIAYQSELVKTENRLKSLESELADSASETGKAGDAAGEASNDIDKLGNASEDAGDKASKGGEGFSTFKMVLADLTASAIKAAVESLKELGEAMLDVGKQAVNSYSDYQQLSGGVEKMFGDSAGTVETYAQNAYKTAGMSANTYMETVTGFSASLLQGLGGDTEKAAQIANAAVIDMSDNANTFGTNIQDIQNAYQGFAKGNYTMLDNLKLGYSGSAEEMLRLVNDAGIAEEKFESLDDVSFDQIIEAIHKVQENTNIAGTTANEASGTIEGSINSTKGAWENFLTAMASGTGLGAAFENLTTSAESVVDNLIPVIEQIADSAVVVIPKFIQAISSKIPEILPAGLKILKALIEGFVGALPEIIPAVVELITFLGQELISVAPQLLEAGIQIILQLADALVETLPEMMPAITQMIMDIAMMLTQPDTLMSLLEAALAIIQALGQGLLASLPILLENLPVIIDNILQFLVQATPLLIEAGVQLFVALVENLPAILEGIGTALLGIWNSIQTYFEGQFENMMNIGSQMFEDFKTGIEEIFPKIKEGIKGLLENIKQIIRNVFTAVKNLGSTLIENFKQGISSVVSRVTTVISNLISDIQNTINSLIDKALGLGESLINNLKQGISNTVGGVTTAISNMVSNISNGIGDAVSDAWNWGVDLIQNFIDGIGHMFDNLRNTVSNVADLVKDFIGFSEPDKGPLSNFHTYAPDMMKLFAQGIKENTWRIEDELKKSLSVVSNGLQFDSLANVTLLPNTQSTSAPAPTMIDNSRTIYQTNNSPKALTRLEIYRQTRNAVNMT